MLLLKTTKLYFISGSSDPMRFMINTEEDTTTPLDETYLEFKTRIVLNDGSGHYITKADASASTYCQINNLSATGDIQEFSPASASNTTATTCKCIYTRNTNALFNKIVILDRTSNNAIETIENPALLGTCLMSSQDPTFWDDGAGLGEADLYAAQVRTFKDPKYYWIRQPTSSQATSS